MSDSTATPIEAPHRISTATLILGVSSAGKTSLLATFAMYLWETYGQILLLYSWDGGAIPTDIQRLIHKGLIRFWRARTRSAPGLALETLTLATKGYWPKRIDPKSGETDPAVGLVAPISTRYTLTCDKGHVIKVVPAASLIVVSQCTTCNRMIPVAEMKVSEAVARTKGFELVGGVAFDGLTSMAQVVMHDMDRMRGHGHIGGEKSSFGGVITSGDLKFGGNNRADVGFAQTRAEQWVGNSLSIPFLKEAPVFTALSIEGTDKGGLTVIGADLPGQAALTNVPTWFGNINEAGSVIDENGKKHYALYLRQFTDSQGRHHLLKTSASSTGQVPGVLIDPPEDEKRPFENFNLGKVFKLLDADLADALSIDLPGAPGMPDGLQEYGDPFRVEATPAPSQILGAGSPTSAPQAGRAGTVAPSVAPKVGAPKVGAPKPAMPSPTTSATGGSGSGPATQGPSVSPAQAVGTAPPPPAGRPPMRAPGK